MGDSVNLNVSASDSDGGTLSYSADNLPDGLSIDPSSGIISGIITQERTPYNSQRHSDSD